jgi:hypothetical protein
MADEKSKVCALLIDHAVQIFLTALLNRGFRSSSAVPSRHRRLLASRLARAPPAGRTAFATFYAFFQASGENWTIASLLVRLVRLLLFWAELHGRERDFDGLLLFVCPCIYSRRYVKTSCVRSRSIFFPVSVLCG